jgi:hypothetical protein
MDLFGAAFVLIVFGASLYFLLRNGSEAEPKAYGVRGGEARSGPSSQPGGEA